MNLTAIKQIVQAEMSGKRSQPYKEIGDKYTHGERTATLALRLRELILPSICDYDNILTVSAWFHDIRNGMPDHCKLSAEHTRELLTGHVTADELEQICHIIAVHGDRNPSDSSYSDIVKIHQDADHLDHFGTLDIWRNIAHTTGQDRTMKDVLKFLHDVRPTEAAKWRSELHFNISKLIFDDREGYVQSFIERFTVEATGGIWNEGGVICPK